ncbi:hypothetical protein V2J09_018726 [Rumex salicifolius]
MFRRFPDKNQIGRGDIMSLGGSSQSSGRRPMQFGQTYVVKPSGRHQATIVWLHGLGDTGGSWSQVLETLRLPNIKWICPTAPSRPIRFDVEDLTSEGTADVAGMDAAAAHVANLLSNEPADVKLGVGGFSMGAAIALYSATCFASGKYGNGDPYPVNLSVVVGLSGWLPSAKSLSEKVANDEAASRASSLPILLCHGTVDDVVQFKFGEASSQSLSASGFQDVKFNSYNRLGHHTIPQETNDVCSWLTSKLSLEGK